MLLRLSVWLTFACGCATTAPLPSAPAARVPTPGTVSRDNPAGDADSPTDAALVRLLEQPIGIKDDKFRTLRPRFADARNWKRVRLFGQPSRAAFRYGDDGYAAAVILYAEAEDDRPRACLDGVVERAHRLATAFDVAVGPLRREMRQFPRGIEAVDRAALEQAATAEYERRKEHLERRRARITQARAAATARRRARLAEARPARLKRSLAAAAPPTEAVSTEEQEQRRRAAEKRRDELMRDHALRVVRHRLIAQAGEVPIPVVLTEGRFQTLLNDDRYLAAIVAYPSWPGTCLVQGFAVRIGSDEELARDVLHRWLDAQAPELKWRMELTGQPVIQNR